MSRLCVVIAHCSGLGLDPRKVPLLIAYLAYAEHDVAHLQEAGLQFAASWLARLPYRVCVGPIFRGGGGVTLVHTHLLSWSQVREHAQKHSLCVCAEPARGAVLGAVNMHLPPALPAALRQAIVGDASAFLRTAGASGKIVAGDPNNAQGPRGGGWLSKALGPKGPLAGFRAQYQPGDPTNVVWQVGRPLECGWTGSSWARRPSAWGRKRSCPLSQHRPDGAVPARVRGTRLRSGAPHLPPLSLVPTHAVAAASFALWWSAHARLTPDGTLQVVWAALQGLVPSQKDC